MKKGDVHWRITLLQILQEVRSICKTRNHLRWRRVQYRYWGARWRGGWCARFACRMDVWCGRPWRNI